MLVGDAAAAVPAKSCSVTCGTGYYACCKGNTFTPVSCRCVPNGTFEFCDSGGANATSCSIGLTSEP